MTWHKLRDFFTGCENVYSRTIRLPLMFGRAAEDPCGADSGYYWLSSKRGNMVRCTVRATLINVRFTLYPLTL